jgi:hypothetical protein
MLNLVSENVQYNSLTGLMFSFTKSKVDATGSKNVIRERKNATIPQVDGLMAPGTYSLHPK